MTSYSLPIEDPSLSKVLTQLHQAAKKDLPKVMKALGKGVYKKIQPEDVSTAYLPISHEQGLYLYDQILNRKSKHIIEFGTSFGISTLYLAAAARQTGGKVITTEIIEEKCIQAQKNFKNAQLENWIELRKGDALETLKDISQAVDLLLLDGWKDLYADVFELLKPHFHSNTIIFVDNTNFKDVKQFLRGIQKNKKYQINKVQVDKGNSATITLRRW